MARINGGKSQPTKARLAVSAGAQPRHWAGLFWPWHPPCDGPGTGPRLRVVGDPWEPSAQLDSSRQLSLLIKHGTDRGSICFGHSEHSASMGQAPPRGQAPCTRTLDDVESIMLCLERPFEFSLSCLKFRYPLPNLCEFFVDSPQFCGGLLFQELISAERLYADAPSRPPSQGLRRASRPFG